MTARLLRGAPVAAELQRRIVADRERLERESGRTPVLVTLLAGDDPAAEAYRASIGRAARKVGILHQPRTLDQTASQDELIAQIRQLNDDPSVTGILPFLPLPAPLSASDVLEHLSPLKDVDGITPMNAGRLQLGLPALRPSTPLGGIVLLDHYGIDLAGMHAVVIGRSSVVGRPFAVLLLQRDATVTLCHRRTRDLAALTRQADLIALAAGAAGVLRGEMVKPGAIVIDFGVNVIADNLVGDADFASVSEVAGAITPVPGGTGPVTSLILMANTIVAGFAARSGSLDAVAEANAF